MDGPSIAQAESSVTGYQTWELVEDLERVDNTGGIDAYGIASARELARRLRALPHLMTEIDRRERVRKNIAALRELQHDPEISWGGSSLPVRGNHPAGWGRP